MQQSNRHSSLETERQIKALAAHNRRAAQDLMARAYLPRLTRHAAAVIRDMAEAKDLAADTIVRSMSEPRLFDPDFRITPWLYRVSFNRALNALRDRRQREAALDLHACALAPTACPVPEELYVAAELEAIVERLLPRLSADHEDIVRLRYHEGLEYKDIAARLGIPVGTVMSRLSRAHASLRDHVRADGIFSELRSYL